MEMVILGYERVYSIGYGQTFRIFSKHHYHYHQGLARNIIGCFTVWLLTSETWGEYKKTTSLDFPFGVIRGNALVAPRPALEKEGENVDIQRQPHVSS